MYLLLKFHFDGIFPTSYLHDSWVCAKNMSLLEINIYSDRQTVKWSSYFDFHLVLDMVYVLYIY